MPRDVIGQARRYLEALESQRDRLDGADNDQLPLFAAAAPREAPPDPLREALAALAPDEMTPRAALDAIYRLRRLLE